MYLFQNQIRTEQNLKSLQFQNFLASISSSFVGRISAKSYWHCVFGNLNSKQFIDQKTLNGQHHITGQSCWPPTLWLELVNFVQKSCCIFDFYACFDSEIKVILWLKLTNMQGHTFQNIITKIKPITLPIIIGVCFTQKVLMKCGIDNISTENGLRKYWFLHLGNCKNSNSCRKY